MAAAVSTGPALLERANALTELATDTPELVVDIDTVRTNVERAATLARDAGVALRPHAKTHKLPQIARMQIDAGAVGIQVAKLGEAEVMIDAGIENVLVGYPIVGERKLRRLAALAERANVSVALDSLEVAAGVSHAAVEHGLTIRVLVELDTGLRRLGARPGAPAVDLAEQIAHLPGIELAGVFTHEGHVYTQARDDAERQRLTQEACAAAVATAEKARSRGLAVTTVSVGSAGTFRFAIRCKGVTEVRPGTYVFNDRSQIAQGACTENDVAAFIVATVVGRPAPERVVVDAGTKVLTSDRMLVGDPPLSFGRVWGHDDWDVVRLSEEHGVLDVPADAEVHVGDRIAIVPNHVCPTINLAERLTIVEDGAVVDQWPVAARGKVQ
jgi:D-serine deaminase-like pyridoxal phosphate-dependent protein